MTTEKFRFKLKLAKNDKRHIGVVFPWTGRADAGQGWKEMT